VKLNLKHCNFNQIFPMCVWRPCEVEDLSVCCRVSGIVPAGREESRVEVIMLYLKVFRLPGKAFFF
jgi:hypothetical protein